MEYLQNGFQLNIAPGTFPLSTDSILLADFAKLPKQANVLDLGSGCGTLGLLLCAKDEGCKVTGIELSEAAHAAALENIDRNNLQDRLFSICADLRSIPSHFPAGSLPRRSFPSRTRFSRRTSNPAWAHILHTCRFNP